MWFCLTILLIIAFFFLIYLRGKSLQNTWDSIFSAVKKKKLRMDLLRDLSERDIDSVLIQYPQGEYVENKEPNKIGEFKNILKDAKIRKIKHKYVPQKMKIKVRASGNEIIYDAFTLASKSTDAFLELLPEYRKYVICLPGLKRWLDENVLSKKR